MSGHDRRPKEAAQLGAYHSMLTGRTGYYLNSRGQRRTIEDEDEDELRMGIVTFCPDGTWAMHEVEVTEAEKAYELALQMRHQSKVSTLYKGKATHSTDDGAFQARLNGELMDAILRIPADAPELGVLMRAWKEAGLPKASEGAVPPERYGEAMALIFKHGSPWQPFPDRPDADPTCPADRWERIAARFTALPVDLREDCLRRGAHLPNPSSRPLVSVTEAQDWDALIALAEEQADRRRKEACQLFRDLSALQCPALWQYLTDDVTTWTAKQVHLYRALWSCIDCGYFEAQDGALVVTGTDGLMETEGKRQMVAQAKRHAKYFGITPVPSKWGDLLGSPLLYAAVVAA